MPLGGIDVDRGDREDPEIPADADGNADLAPDAMAAFDHEYHLVERRVLDVDGVHTEAEIGQIEAVFACRLDRIGRILQRCVPAR